MTFASCNPCDWNCIPGTIPNDTFKQGMFIMLCNLIAATEAQALRTEPWTPLLFPALTNAPEEVFTGPGQFGGYYISNDNDGPVYLQVFDTDGVPAGTPTLSLDINTAANLEMARGVQMMSGMKIRASTTVAGDDPPVLPLVANIFFDVD